MTTFRWGILGAGNIAKKFATGLQALTDAKLVAVGSRSLEKANAFADPFGAPRRHGSYEALAADPEVDAIYVATPHPMHKGHSILCLEHGKAVLCEKPFTVNEKEAREVVALSRRKRLFLMEAMWTRFLPVMVETRKRIADGAIGEVRMVSADFGFRSGVNPQGRLFSPALAGGGLMDVGVYTVSFASDVFKAQPDTIATAAHLGDTGVDEQAGMVFSYSGGRLALLSCAIRTRTPHEATVFGTDGWIRYPSSFWNGTKAILRRGNDEEVIDAPYAGNGYNCEAAEVARCVRAGLIESPTVSHDESIAVMNTLDRIRAQWGLTYPME